MESTGSSLIVPTPSKLYGRLPIRLLQHVNKKTGLISADSKHPRSGRKTSPCYSGWMLQRRISTPSPLFHRKGRSAPLPSRLLSDGAWVVKWARWTRPTLSLLTFLLRRKSNKKTSTTKSRNSGNLRPRKSTSINLFFQRTICVGNKSLILQSFTLETGTKSV